MHSTPHSYFAEQTLWFEWFQKCPPPPWAINKLRIAPWNGICSIEGLWYLLQGMIFICGYTFVECFLPASPKVKAGLGVQSLRPSVRPKILSSQLLWNYWSNYHETWYVDRTSHVVMHIGRKFWSPHFCGSYAPWNLENTHKWPCHRNSLKLLIRFSWNLVCR